MKYIFIFLFILCFHAAPCQQTDSLNGQKEADSLIRQHRNSPGFFLLLGEILIGGISYAASKPTGDKIVGWTFAGGSVLAVVITPAIWKGSKEFSRKERITAISTTVVTLGFGYGFYRVAGYNLWKARGDSEGKRFWRNMMEMHAAYIIPIGAGYMVDRILRKNKPARQETSLMLSPSSIGLVIRL